MSFSACTETDVTHSGLSRILTSKRKRGELVVQYLKKRNAVIQQLRDYEEQLIEAITPIRIGDIILFNRFSQRMTITKMAGRVINFNVRVSVTDVFVAVFTEPCPVGVMDDLNTIGIKTTTGCYASKVLLSDVIAILAKKGSYPEEGIIP